MKRVAGLRLAEISHATSPGPVRGSETAAHNHPFLGLPAHPLTRRAFSQVGERVNRPRTRDRNQRPDSRAR
jgi:hypothetical protein